MGFAKKNKNEKQHDKKAVFGNNLSFGASEAYKLLRTNLMLSTPESEGNCKVIGLSSPLENEGKSTTVVNLAYSIAQAGKGVLVIDCDMRKPTINKYLNIKSTPGLSNVITGMANISDVVVNSELHKNLYVIPVGNLPPNPSELLGSKTMENVISALSKKFDYILIDLPPINSVSDALVASKFLHGIIIVVRQDYCVHGALLETVHQLEFLQIKIFGFVMTRGSSGKHRYGKYGKYYKYGGYYGTAKSPHLDPVEVKEIKMPETND